MRPHCLGLRVLRGQQRTHVCRNGIIFVVFLEFVTILRYFGTNKGIIDEILSDTQFKEKYARFTSSSF